MNYLACDTRRMPVGRHLPACKRESNELGILHAPDTNTQTKSRKRKQSSAEMIIIYPEINIGYTMKPRGIRDLDHRGNLSYRRPEREARGRLFRFPR